MSKLPRRGRSREEVRDSLAAKRAEDADWRSGRTFSLVYFAGEDVVQVLRDAASAFIMENALSPLAFPSLRQLENEVLGIAAELFHGPSAAGSMTTGGFSVELSDADGAQQFGDEWAKMSVVVRFGKLSALAELLGSDYLFKHGDLTKDEYTERVGRLLPVVQPPQAKAA